MRTAPAPKACLTPGTFANRQPHSIPRPAGQRKQTAAGSLRTQNGTTESQRHILSLACYFILVFPLLFVGCGPQISSGNKNTTDLPQGNFHVEIDTSGGPAEFQLSIRSPGSPPNAILSHVRSGGHAWDITETTWQDDTLRLSMPDFDAEISLRRASGNAWQGTYKRRRSATEWAELTTRMSPPLPIPPRGDANLFTGRWKVKFADDTNPALANFRLAGGQLLGTFQTVTGDYRHLGGYVTRETTPRLVLSTFDGGHVFRFTATRQPDGSLRGDFWSGDWYHTTWTATPAGQYALPDGFGLTKIVNASLPTDLQFPNLQGQPTSLTNLTTGAPVKIIEIFGSWCPNCHDAAQLLSELQTHYTADRLRVIGLAFELTGDAERDRRQVQRYVERFQIDYPVLIAGLADKEVASQQLPLIDRVRAYPTFLFVDAQNRIAATYTGFSGPATGDAHEQLRQAFMQTIDGLLADSQPSREP